MTFSKSKRQRVLEDGNTFNGLPNHLQWQPGMSDDHVFPEEMDMIRQLKAELGALVGHWSDKLILYFLFARRCDVNEARRLIIAYTNMLEEIGWLHDRPTLDDAPLLKSGLILCKNGGVDKYDRLLVYFNAAHMRPGQFTKTESLLSLVYETNFIVDTQPVRYLRNGFTEIVDLQGFDWRNLDTSQQGKELIKAMQGVFPRRTRQFWVINGSSILRWTLKAARIILPAKIIERIESLDVQCLSEVVDQKWIPTKYGGQCDITLEGMISELREYDGQRNNRRTL